jgi:hypothetical protein
MIFPSRLRAGMMTKDGSLEERKWQTMLQIPGTTALYRLHLSKQTRSVPLSGRRAALVSRFPMDGISPLGLEVTP